MRSYGRRGGDTRIERRVQRGRPQLATMARGNRRLFLSDTFGRNREVCAEKNLRKVFRKEAKRGVNKINFTNTLKTLRFFRGVFDILVNLTRHGRKNKSVDGNADKDI